MASRIISQTFFYAAQTSALGNSCFFSIDCVTFVPSLLEAYKGFKPGQADVVFVSSDKSADVQRLYMEDGVLLLHCCL